MHSLSTVPGEILFLISEYLEQPDRLTLLRCSRHFHHLLLPLIWRSLGTCETDFHANGISIFVNNDAESRKIKGLNIVHCVTALVQRPFLASYPRDLTMRCEKPNSPGKLTENETYTELIKRLAWEPDDSDDNDDTGRLVDLKVTPCDFRLIHEKVKLACGSEAEAKLWMRDLRTLRDSDAWSGLLLTLVPNLLVLVMDVYPCMKYTPWVIERAAYRQFNSLPVLNKLVEINLASYNHHTYLVAMPLLELPSIRKVCCFQLSGASPDKLGPRPDSSVTDLVLLFSQSVLDWIHRCKGLKRLTYSSTDLEIGRGVGFSLQELYAAILSTQNTLKYLHFHPSYLAYPKRFVPPFGRFHEFKALKHLHIASNQLFDCTTPIIPVPDFSRILPKTLKTLHIMDIRLPSFLQVMIGLANHVSGNLHYTPRLKRLIVEAQFTPQGDRCPPGFFVEYASLPLDDVESTFGQMGVSIEFTNYYNEPLVFINDHRHLRTVILRPDSDEEEDEETVDVFQEWCVYPIGLDSTDSLNLQQVGQL